MRIPEIIAAKRDGAELSPEDVTHIVADYARGDVPDYQMSAFLMAAYIRGLSHAETLAMTWAMVESGDIVDLSGIDRPTVDKHSTGGVGDKTTLIVVPLLAACGAAVPKMSGRGLGFTGGTLDKLESIPGFRTDLSVEELLRQVRKIGAAIVGQTPGLVPADKKIYALRDVTATTDSIPLISASVMSKKIACGSSTIVLDVKCGSGAFMTDMGRASLLAKEMIGIGRGAGRRTAALVTDMSKPLGRAVGNSLEVAEALETLHGSGPADLRELSLQIAALALEASGIETDPVRSRSVAESALDSGAALGKFREIVAAQGGDVRVVDDPRVLPAAEVVEDVLSVSGGVVESIDCRAVAQAASLLGAGRERKEDSIRPEVGIVMIKTVGDPVSAGDLVAVVHAADHGSAAVCASAIREAVKIGQSAPDTPLVREIIR